MCHVCLLEGSVKLDILPKQGKMFALLTRLVCRSSAWTYCDKPMCQIEISGYEATKGHAKCTMWGVVVVMASLLVIGNSTV